MLKIHNFLTIISIFKDLLGKILEVFMFTNCYKFDSRYVCQFDIILKQITCGRNISFNDYLNSNRMATIYTHGRGRGSKIDMLASKPGKSLCSGSAENSEYTSIEPACEIEQKQLERQIEQEQREKELQEKQEKQEFEKQRMEEELQNLQHQKQQPHQQQHQRQQCQEQPHHLPKQKLLQLQQQERLNEDLTINCHDTISGHLKRLNLEEFEYQIQENQELHKKSYTSQEHQDQLQTGTEILVSIHYLES